MALDKKFIKQIEAKLLAEKKQIENDLADFTVKQGKESKAIFPEYGDHSGENAAEVMSYDSDLSVKNTLEKTLRDINSSLKRVKDGDYGKCKYCAKDISPKRLEIRPTSSACIECKKKFSGE